MTLSIGFSPCPNDCFMFDAIVHRRVDLEGLEFAVVMDDVEALNRAAFAGAIDVTKLSYHALAYCAAQYAVLDAGSALGRGCGPLLIARTPLPVDEVRAGHLRIAIPGRYTTANLLLRLAFPAARDTVEMVFSDIEGAVLDGRVDAGAIIHENRFTYEARGLHKILDLGDEWERTTGCAIPLGAIVIRRALSEDVMVRMNRVLRRSVEFALEHPEASQPFVRAHAQEMDPDVMARHIALYVNPFSVDLGVEGRAAVARLFDRAAAVGAIPQVPDRIFAVSGTRVGAGHTGRQRL
jgi:1,4-dihydroxy-6-naphthoate synthase